MKKVGVGILFVGCLIIVSCTKESSQPTAKNEETIVNRSISTMSNSSSTALVGTVGEFGTTFKKGQQIFYIVLKENNNIVYDVDKSIAIKYGLIQETNGIIKIISGEGTRAKISYEKSGDSYMLTSFEKL